MRNRRSGDQETGLAGIAAAAARRPAAGRCGAGGPDITRRSRFQMACECPGLMPYSGRPQAGG
ncbi:MAG TPA: hypothetical protein VLD67_08270, partial [Vicinamibacterales bacterium]|nr:hypothetical protein [Vicinamibacterales bacterium]